MSRLIFDKDENEDSALWTTARLIDELFLNLASVKETILVINYEGEVVNVRIHKYYHQAREKMYRIPIAKGTVENMSFVIHLSHLRKNVKAGLDQYYREAGQKGIAIILKLAVCKLFENLDLEYTHLSVMKQLKVRMME